MRLAEYKGLDGVTWIIEVDTGEKLDRLVERLRRRANKGGKARAKATAAHGVLTLRRVSL